MRGGLIAIVLAASLAAPALAEIKPLAEVLDGTAAETGLLRVHVDRGEGRILLQLPPPDTDGVAQRVLYIAAMESGVGSSAIGIDRAASGFSGIIAFRRLGGKVLVEAENARFRASGRPEAEQRAVGRSFASSNLWMGDVAAETADGGFLVDMAPFLARDPFDIAGTIEQGGGGEFEYDKDRSVADPNFVRVFPGNIELRGRLTFKSDDPQTEITNIAPDGGSVSVAVRHSFIALPEPGYQPRRLDPRAGSFGTQIVDYGAPLGQPVVYELANRFRLDRTDPAAERSTVREPIVFYVDPGAPEPVRSALIEGAGWWREAFEAAGLVDAYRVELLPEDADPLDIRYNAVNWVNRATRGWSYGQANVDPRTGEIVKGAVLLGSLRVRQDIMIFEALVGAGLSGSGDPNDPVEAALARIRQLAAHEVGHALGLEHNFAGSAQGRYSVMDYPAPRVRLTDGAIDLSDAYGVGLGEWDRFAIRWLYGARDEAEADRIMAEGLADGLRFVADGDARSAAAAHPLGSLWDDFSDPAAELDRVMAVRRIAVDRFGPAAIAAGQPVSQLRRSFVPIWLLHRYQIDAAAKLLGGVDFSYSLNGDGMEAASPVPPAHQRAALDALLATLTPEALSVPANVMPYLSASYSGNTDRQTSIELIESAGGPVFDPLEATETGAAVTLGALLAPDRLDRLEIQNQADPAQPGGADTIDALIGQTFGFDGRSSRAGVQRRIATVTALALARVQRDADLSPTIALALSDRLARLADDIDGRGSDVQSQWGRGLAALLRDREALDAAIADESRLPSIPPGSPIG